MDVSALDPANIPTHVAAVMDGNGRWATQRGLKRTEGHRQGEHALFDTVMGALDAGVRYFTVYAFSTENWRRPADEVKFLIEFNEQILLARRDELNELGVQMRFIGRRNWRVPRRLIKRMDEATALTAGNRKLIFTIAFNYGGRAEIVDAVRSIVASGIKPDKVDEKMIARHLYDPELPDPDLMIRTSGECRLSNFLIWELAYSELVFTDVLWPDFDRTHLWAAIAEYQDRVRRFGAVES